MKTVFVGTLHCRTLLLQDNHTGLTSSSCNSGWFSLAAEDMIVVIIKWSGRQHTGFTQAQSLDSQATTLGYVLSNSFGWISLPRGQQPASQLWYFLRALWLSSWMQTLHSNAVAWHSHFSSQRSVWKEGSSQEPQLSPQQGSPNLWCKNHYNSERTDLHKIIFSISWKDH